MPEGVRRDPANGLFTKDLTHTVCDNVASSCCGDGLDLFAGAFVVTGEEGQGRGYLFLSKIFLYISLRDFSRFSSLLLLGVVSMPGVRL